MSDNTMVLPGDIPQLLRRGSPVLLPNGSSMTVHRFGDGGAWGASGFGRFVNGTMDGADMGGLRLDLTDRTGFLHACEWLAAKLRIAVGDIVMSFDNGGDFIEVEPDRLDWDGFYATLECSDTYHDDTAEIDLLAVRHAVLRLAGRTA